MQVAHMKSSSEKLLDVTPGYAARHVALMISDKLIENAKTEMFRFRINHDVRPPKCLACPINYDWVLKDHVGIETKNKLRARVWLTNAALKGYIIDEVDHKHQPTGGRSESIDIVRKRAEYHQRSKTDDDDIPF